MIISRKEFYERENFRAFQTIKEVEELMSVERLYKEVMADAPFRNHEYLINPKLDFHKMKLQEDHVGIKKKFPEIKTEGERVDKISQEIKENTYLSVPIFRDSDYPDVIYIDDGFHRIHCAHLMGYKVIRVKSKYGKFVLAKSLRVNELPELIDMMIKMFGKDLKLTQVKDLLIKAREKIPDDNMVRAGLSYGREPHHEKNTQTGYVV